MKLSVKSDYAARAVLALARHHPEGKAVRVETLAAAQAMPAGFLVQILLELKAAGIVRSVRGKEGGYLLARPPQEVTMASVIRAVHGTVFDTPALTDPGCPPELRRAWLSLQRTLETAAEAIHFHRLVEEAASKENLYYI